MTHTTRGIESRVALRWIERALFVTGGMLALWCAVVAGRAYYYSQLGVPPPTRIAQLPGESPGATARAVPAPEPGAWIARLEAASISSSRTRTCVPFWSTSRVSRLYVRENHWYSGCSR
jgi:hypothetical protein